MPVLKPLDITLLLFDWKIKKAWAKKKKKKFDSGTGKYF